MLSACKEGGAWLLLLLMEGCLAVAAAAHTCGRITSLTCSPSFTNPADAHVFPLNATHREQTFCNRHNGQPSHFSNHGRMSLGEQKKV